ncbi:hypothetical protein VMCG_02239 [Cytospora schulzeri]|uniref:Zn(2)-C6 fungal-type domain-containing protein n=1 Tax=Cytospora schulzeri TaxID=448051 RepID=A0A423X256_9PEZI|nr:hypothetical protein VMCG_02239 [Valsa malicola]
MATAPDPGDASGMLRGENGQTVADIDTLAPMTAEEESAAQQRWGTDTRQWPTLQQQQWLRRLSEDDREEYIDTGTWRLYQIRLNSAAAGLTAEEEAQAMRDIESLVPMGQAERDWTEKQFKSADPKDWPPLARRRYIRSLDRSQWLGELARVEPPRPAAQQNNPCTGCQLTNDIYCDADPELGIGCSQCRQRKRRCVCDGRQLVDRPSPERNFRLKCQNCQVSGEDCQWCAAPMNLHYACGNCVQKGVDCFAQVEGPPPPDNAPEVEAAPPPRRLGLAASHPAMYRAAATGQGGDNPSAAPPPAGPAQRRIRRPRAPRTRPGQASSGPSQDPPANQGAGPSASSQPGSSGGQMQNSQLFYPVESRRRKLPGGRYTQEEAPLSDAERARIQKRQLIQANMKKCRTCTLNDVKNNLCTRMSMPDTSNVACDRCDRLGIECVDLATGTVFQPRMELTGAGRRNLLTFWPCVNCETNNLCCDRSRPCAQCRTRGIECPESRRAQNTFRHGTAFGTTEPRYFLAMGYGPWGIGSQRPPNRPDLPGPMDRPFFVTRGHPSELVARPEFLNHLAANQGQLNLSDFDLTVPGPPYTGMNSSGEVPAQPLPNVPGTPQQQTGDLGSGGQASVFISPGRSGADPVSQAGSAGGDQAAVAGPSQQQGPGGSTLPEQWHVNDPNNNGLPQQGARGNSAPAQYFPPFEVPSPGQGLLDPALQDQGPDEMEGIIDLPPIQSIDDAQQGQAPVDIGDLALLLADDAQERRSPSPGPVSGPLTRPGLFSMEDFKKRALGSIPYTPLWDPLFLEFDKTCMEVLRRTDDVSVQCENDSFGKKCADLGHLPPDGSTFYVCDPCHEDSRSSIWLGRLLRDDVMAMRAYACNVCLRDMVRRVANPFTATGTSIFGEDKPNPDTVAVQVDGKEIGGVQGPGLLPITGCACGSKLVQARQCTNHRDTHLANLKLQASRLSEYRLNNHGRKICPICMLFNGVDHYDFEGVEGGGVQRHILAYACMICHSLVVARGEEGSKAGERLLDVIPGPPLPAAPQQMETSA